MNSPFPGMDPYLELIDSEQIPPSHRTAYQVCVWRGWQPRRIEQALGWFGDLFVFKQLAEWNVKAGEKFSAVEF
jgi:hypothetical protein